jgi:hypothetical protein
VRQVPFTVLEYPTSEKRQAMRTYGKSAQTIAKELMEKRDSCAIHRLTFSPTGNLTAEQIRELEENLHERFLNWWDSWIGPKLREISEKGRHLAEVNQDA